MVQYLEATGTGHVVNVVAANIRVWLAIAIVKREHFRCARNRGVDNIRRKQDALAVDIGLKSAVEQSLPHFLAADFHPGFRHDAFGLVEDFRDELVGEDT